VGEMRRGGRLVSAPLLHPRRHSSFAGGKGLVEGDLTPDLPGHSAISASTHLVTRYTKPTQPFAAALRATRHQVARRRNGATRWQVAIEVSFCEWFALGKPGATTRVERRAEANTPSAPHLAHRTLRVRSRLRAPASITLVATMRPMVRPSWSLIIRPGRMTRRLEVSPPTRQVTPQIQRPPTGGRDARSLATLCRALPVARRRAGGSMCSVAFEGSICESFAPANDERPRGSSKERRQDPSAAPCLRVDLVSLPPGAIGHDHCADVLVAK
jgi:hypothetical protein